MKRDYHLEFQGPQETTSVTLADVEAGHAREAVEQAVRQHWKKQPHGPKTVKVKVQIVNEPKYPKFFFYAPTGKYPPETGDTP